MGNRVEPCTHVSFRGGIRGSWTPSSELKNDHIATSYTPLSTSFSPRGDNLFKVHCRRDYFVTSCVTSYGRRLFKLLSARKIYILPSMFSRISVFYLSYRRCWVSWKIYGKIYRKNWSYECWCVGEKEIYMQNTMRNIENRVFMVIVFRIEFPIRFHCFV